MLLTASLEMTFATVYVFAAPSLEPYNGMIYSAIPFEESPNETVYTLTQLNCEYYDTDGHYLWIRTLGSEPFPLTIEEPIFTYNDRLWQVSGYSISKGLPPPLQTPFAATSLLCWLTAGLVFLKRKRNEVQ